ncbi:hypothetical protein CJ030_MR5G001739 [Morella rubra]|uniref:Malectin-like domain-containing protein n=1 Tax=Morella rubra TaxID=262757 RepID=A0A6A1VH46_9ROSI|nr:hypothetical protein CJ030_MR5G001739 [Morella rubra]
MTTYLTLLFLVALSAAVSTSFAAFVSINCGSSEPYFDVQDSLNWTGDGDYVHNGVPQLVNSFYGAGPILSTLRVFPSLQKNCYTINNLQNGERVLVRASFYYGNYDGKHSPPEFDLLIDGSHLRTMSLQKYADNAYLITEIIYVVNGNATSFCLARTLPNQLPFINALELRSLGPKMYNRVGSKSFLLLRNRVAQGANQTIRRPDDPYDRFWFPNVPDDQSSHLEVVASEAATIDVSSAEDQPPPAVLRTAIASTGTRVPLALDTNLKAEGPIYINVYFSEVLRLDSTQKRSIQLYIDDRPYLEPIIPPFGSVSEACITNITAAPNTTFTAQASSNSTLPPLLNAYEVYAVVDAQPYRTRKKDVQGLMALQTAFSVLQLWTGDPCLPLPYSWEWIECNTAAMPQVIALNLSGFGLLGSLPDFSSMDALQTIDLHNNNLEGPIPEFFGSFPNLTLLVTNNCINGRSCPPLISPSPSPSLSPIEAPPPSVMPTSSPGTPLPSNSTPSHSGQNRNIAKLPIILEALIQILLLSLLLISYFY